MIHKTQKLNKLTAENFAARLKQANLVNKTDFDNKLISFHRKITSNETIYIEVQKKLNSLITKEYNFFLFNTIYFTSNDEFVYQSALGTLELKKDKGTDYALIWKSKGVYNSKLKLLFTVLFNSIKHSEYKIGVKFDKILLAVEQNDYLSKIANIYTVYNLDACPRNPNNNFKLRNCFFVATSTVKNSDKENYVYSGYGIAFDSPD